MASKKKFFDRMRDFLEDIERDVIEAFGEFFEERCTWDPEQCSLEPLTNFIETHNEIIITADLPYVKRENIKLHVTDDMLDLQATLEHLVKFAQWGTVQRNTEFKRFHKTIKLPGNVDTDKISATFKKGILQIRIPKKITRIKIKIE
ncbi:MAG: Hsp20/alpha crystallin family protein [Candidatus Helarchaeota archaeon]